ncbi:glycosyltransferase family 2 protein [Peterkaempfera bronchialis]|uniref:glycosyltransferase family 2 protein n=1 Tax=Peterkaempfera bronchialis TaxID=2126346 RepID=UPI001E47AA32|nr:glycosyltransferase family 2 protein [Peterkaempfera bronchialis]
MKLSVVVPFYNVRAYAPDALRSLAANARSDFEFILVDDGSTDGTSELLESWGRDRPRVRLIRHERNRGISATRNTGMAEVGGRYLTFLDGDDWFAPGYLPRLLDAIEGFGCDFVRTDHVRCTGSSREIHRAPEARRDEVLSPRESILPADRSTMVDYPYSWAGIYHRRLLDGGLLHFDEDLHTAEDRPWIWRLHRHAGTYAVTGLRGVFYRRAVATSLTQIGDVRQLDFVPAFDRLLKELAEDPEAELLLPKAVRTYLAVMVHHRRNADRLQRGVARTMRTLCADALRRLPQDHLDEAVAAMDSDRAATIRRLRGGLTAVVAR